MPKMSAMRGPCRGHLLHAIVCAMLFVPAYAAAGTWFPDELSGSWDLGREACHLPLNPDADSSIHIEGRRILRYEDTATASSIKRISTLPRAWLVVATSDAAPDVITRDLYVVNGDKLTVTNGSETVEYRRCAAPIKGSGSFTRRGK